MFCNKLKEKVFLYYYYLIDVVREKSHYWLQELYKLFLRLSFYYVLICLIYRSEYGILQQESN